MAEARSGAPVPGDGAGGPDPARLADRALDMAAELAGAAAQVQVKVDTGVRSLTRFAGSAIHQNVTEEVLRVRLVITVDGRTAAGSGDSDDDDALRRLATATHRAAGLRPVDPEWPGLAPPAEIPAVAHFDDATAAAPATARAQVVRDFVEAARGLECAGYCDSLGLTTAYANSAGQRAAGSISSATIDGIARAPQFRADAGRGDEPVGGGGRSASSRPSDADLVVTDGTAMADGSGRSASLRLGDLDGAAAGERAAATARAAAAEPLDIEPGHWPVVLSPGAVRDMLMFLSVYGLAARPVHENRSYAVVGEQQMDPAVTVLADPLDPRVPALPFDAEGTPCRRLELIRAGVTNELAADRRDARIAGRVSTGSAVEHAWFGGGFATHLTLVPGACSFDELVGGLERGLLVTDFWYTRVLDPRTLVVTGLTRNGVFLVEDGRITGPVRNLRFTQSYAGALAPGNVAAIGDDLTLHVDEGFSLLAPSLRLEAWNITGTARG